MGHQFEQEIELARLERDRPRVDPCFARGLIDFQAAETADRRLFERPHRATAAAPQQRFDPRDELARRKRLADVVVGTHLQADDAIDLFRAGGHHDHGNRAPFTPQRSQDLKSVQAGQADIEQQQVGHVARRSQRSKTVGYGERSESLAFQVVEEQFSNRRIVFGNRDGRAGGHIRPSAHGWARCATSLVVREVCERAERRRVLPKHRVDRGCRKASPLQHARRGRIGDNGRFGGDSGKRVTTPRTLVRLPLRDLRGRHVAIDAFTNELAHQARVAKRLSLALQEQARKEPVVHEAVALATFDGFMNLNVLVAFASEAVPELRFGQALARQRPQCGSVRVSLRRQWRASIRSSKPSGPDARESW